MTGGGEGEVYLLQMDGQEGLPRGGDIYPTWPEDLKKERPKKSNKYWTKVLRLKQAWLDMAHEVEKAKGWSHTEGRG